MSHFYWNLLWWFAFLCFVHFIIIKSDYFQKRKLGRIFHNNGNMFSRQKFGKKKKHSRQIFTWRGVLFIQFFLFLQFVWFQPFIHLIKIYFGPIYNYYIFFVLNTLECAVNTPGVGGEHSGVKSVDLVKFWCVAIQSLTQRVLRVRLREIKIFQFQFYFSQIKNYEKTYTNLLFYWNWKSGRVRIEHNIEMKNSVCN